MKMKAPHHILLAVLGLIALVLSGCGGNEDLAKELGCPSGSIMANSDDQIFIRTTEPDQMSFFAGPSFVWAGPGAPMGVIPMTATQYSFPYSTYWGPLIVEVQGPFNTRRNNICVVLTSDGFFWDKDFTAVKGSSSVGYTRFVTKTDAAGQATIWWSTGLVVSSNTASGTTAGADYTNNDRVTASSGAAPQANWNASYTVSGCPPATVCP